MLLNFDSNRFNVPEYALKVYTLTNEVPVTDGKIIKKKKKKHEGKKKSIEFAGGSAYQVFEFPTVKLQ